MNPLEAQDGPGAPGAGGGADGGLILPRSSRRRGGASVTLREGGAPADDLASMMDPATKSLGDALRFTYVILQISMGLLLVFFVGLSGFRTAGVNEHAVRVTMGKLSTTPLEPGLHWGLPEPFGELIKVETGDKSADIKKQFFPNLTDGEEQLLVKDGTQALVDTGGDKLDPKVDGMLLTGDGNIAHMRWSMTYRRTDPAKYVRNVRPEDEEQIVLAAARRGIVHASASVTVDELMKGQLDTSARVQKLGSMETLAQKAAQKLLDAMETGIVIQQLTITQRIPPRRVMREFNRVLSAQAEAKTTRDNARTEANGLLSAVAGDASELLLEQIDRYEKALASGDERASAAVLGTIDSILQGEAVEVDGQPVKPAVFGEVTKLIGDANEYRTTLVNRTQADMGLFQAKLAAFKSSPMVMVNGDWAAAYRTFLSKPGVQTMYLPEGTERFILMLNRDPSITAEQDSIAKQKEFDEAERERNRARERERFEQRVDPATKARAEP